jgi:antitoxin ChpS
MYSAALRSVGGSVMMTLPKSLLTENNLSIGSKVNIQSLNGQIIITPQKKKRYTLEELLAQCDPSLPMSAEELEWLNAPDVGLEVFD